MADLKQYDYQLLKQCGLDVFISANVEIRRPHLVSVGRHVAIDSGFYLTTRATIGDFVHLGPYITAIGGEKSSIIVDHFVTIAAGTRLIAGSDSFLGEGFTSVTVPQQYRDEVKFSTITIKCFAGIGTNVVIMPGITIAEGSVVGACALVTKDTKPWTIYAGVPAKPIKMRKSEKMLTFAKELGY
ncbi:MAG: acyltransferase [Bacteroidetes bacterium]|nr:acyltransferase [Bacteroidota bacterium]MBS1540532.1 acyltransferase [Bacteroidota bacterium]